MCVADITDFLRQLPTFRQAVIEIARFHLIHDRPALVAPPLALSSESNFGEQLDLRRQLCGACHRLFGLAFAYVLDRDEKHPSRYEKTERDNQQLNPAKYDTLLF